MSYSCSFQEQSALPTMAVRRRAPVEQLSDVLGHEYGRIFQMLQAHGSIPSGPPFVIYRNMDMQDLDLEIGFPVVGDLESEGDVVRAEIPAGRVAACLYTGPYEGIGEAYDGLMRWMEEHGVEGSGFSYEFYLNDPFEVPPSEIQTDIRIPLKV
jgi:effector-binding domain-containing protein